MQRLPSQLCYILVRFPFWTVLKTDNYTQRGSRVFLRVSYVQLQEAVLYLGRPRGPQQGVSLAALLQPVLLWEGFSRVLRHGVGLLLQSQRAESRTTKLQTFTPSIKSRTSHRRTYQRPAYSCFFVVLIFHPVNATFRKRVFGPVCYIEGHFSADYVLKKIMNVMRWMWGKKGII